MDTEKIAAVSRALGALREELDYSDLPAQMVQIFLEVASMGELTQQDLESRVGVSRAAISRFLSILSVGRPTNPGLRLLETFEDPEYRRRKIVRITARGKAVAKIMVGAMGK